MSSLIEILYLFLIFCYNIVVDSACRLGLKNEAYQVVREMKRNGLAPDAVTWRILDKLHGNKRSKPVFVEDSTLLSRGWIQETEMDEENMQMKQIETEVQ